MREEPTPAPGVNKQPPWLEVLMAEGDEMAVTFKGGICEPQI